MAAPPADNAAAAADADAPLFSPSLIGDDVRRALPAGYTVRPLQRSDFHRGFLDVLRVLTTVGDISEEVSGRSLFDACLHCMSFVRWACCDWRSAWCLVLGLSSARLEVRTAAQRSRWREKSESSRQSSLLCIRFSLSLSLHRAPPPDRGPLTLPTTPQQWDERYGWMAARSDEYFLLCVADADGRVVGTGALVVERKFIHNLGLVGHIEDIAVAKDQQGKKLGLRIIHALDGVADRVGCYKVRPPFPFLSFPFLSLLHTRRLVRSRTAACCGSAASQSERAHG